MGDARLMRILFGDRRQYMTSRLGRHGLRR